MEDILVICKKCGNKVPSSQMKLDFDIGLMICPDCIKSKKIHKEIEKDVYRKEEKKSEEIQKDKVAHKCASCGFKFKIDLETKKPKNCPYCNARVLSF